MEFKSESLHDETRTKLEDNIVPLINEVYNDAVTVRNYIPDETRTAKLRNEGRQLYELTDKLCSKLSDIIENLADEIEDVDTEYMVHEGWELSFHDPEEFDENFVFICRLIDQAYRIRSDINWLFDEDLNPPSSKKEDIVTAADNITYSMKYVDELCTKVDIELTKIY